MVWYGMVCCEVGSSRFQAWNMGTRVGYRMMGVVRCGCGGCMSGGSNACDLRTRLLCKW